MRISENVRPLRETGKLTSGNTKKSSNAAGLFDNESRRREYDNREAGKSLNPMGFSTRLNAGNVPAAEEELAPFHDENRNAEIEAYMLREHGIPGEVEAAKSHRSSGGKEDFDVYFFNSDNKEEPDKIIVELKFGEVLVLDAPEGFNADNFQKFTEKGFMALMKEYVFKNNNYGVDELKAIFERKLEEGFWG